MPVHMTRQQMIDVIRNQKGSVLIGHTVYTRVEDLPSEADIAVGDREKEEEARARLLDQKRRADEALDKLDRSQHEREQAQKAAAAKVPPPTQETSHTQDHQPHTEPVPAHTSPPMVPTGVQQHETPPRPSVGQVKVEEGEILTRGPKPKDKGK